jgi:hypothetical protein
MPYASVVAASRDKEHPQFHLSLGKVLATILLGSFDALAAQQNPTNSNIDSSITAFLGGFLQIWLPPTQPPS